MWDFKAGQAMGLMLQTMPFIILRLVIYFGITLAFIIVTGVGAGIGWGVGIVGGPDFQGAATFWGGLIGFGVTAGVVFLIREYLLYMVKAGHIAVLVALLDGQQVKQGREQIELAQAEVKARFAEASVLFAIDQIVKGVLRAVTGLAQGIVSILPIPGLQNMVGLLRAFLNIAVGFIDEVILAYGIRTRSENPWQSAQDALILYGQNYKVMLKNAAWLTLFVYGLSLLVFIVFLAPAGALALLFPNGWGAFGIIIALLGAWSVKSALIEPFAITCMMQVYFPAIEGQTPNPEWDQRLSEMSGKFRKLKEKATDWMRGRPSDAASQ